MKWVIITLLLFSTVSTTTQGAELIRCAYQNSSNFPFQLGSGLKIKRDKPGIAVEMVKMLESSLGTKITLQRLPWKRAEQRLREGGIDCLFNASFKKNRLINGQYPMFQGRVDVSKRSYYNSYAIYSLQNSDIQWDGNQLSNLSKKKIGAQSGFSIISDLNTMNIDVHQASSIEQLMKLVKYQRIAAAVVFEPLAETFLKIHHDDYINIRKITPRFKKKAYYLMLSHQFVQKSPKLSEQIWSAIAKIRESQAFKVMVQKYSQ
jgi:polar amino acid transport system substrate-binding protein